MFAKVIGEPLHPERASREFSRPVERWGLPKLAVHGLRHTWATLAMEDRVHMTVVQKRLGHTTSTTTLDLYTHAPR